MLERFVLVACLLAAPAAYAQQADDYPNRTVKIVVSAPAGGGLDVAARIIAERLRQKWNQPFIVENRPGASGNTGTEAVINAEPDGYTLLAAQPAPLTVNPLLYKKQTFDPTTLEPVAIMTAVPNLLVVRPNFPAVSAQDFIAHAKANPGKLNFGNAGAGNVTHLTGEMLRAATGIEFVNVPHRGGAESITALLGRQVDFILESPVVLLPLIGEGKLRALAVTSASRKSEIADIPTMREGGADFVATLLTGVVAPAGTPGAIVGQLNAVINDTLKSADMQATLARFGSEARIMSAPEFATFIAGETKKWADVARAARVQVD
jgi:tripartite-type tricarboxylate transporter receptor subunit TctC